MHFEIVKSKENSPCFVFVSSETSICPKCFPIVSPGASDCAKQRIYEGEWCEGIHDTYSNGALLDMNFAIPDTKKSEGKVIRIAKKSRKKEKRLRPSLYYSLFLLLRSLSLLMPDLLSWLILFYT